MPFLPHIKILQLILLSLTLLLVACSSNKSKVGGYFNFDTDVKLTFTIASDINPDDNGKPAPLFIRLYELKSNKMFEKADFIDLYERDQEALGADFLGKTSLKPFIPGHSRVEKMVLSQEAQYVGLYAEFLRYKGASYKALIPIVGNNVFTSSAKIYVTGNKITVVGKKKKK